MAAKAKTRTRRRPIPSKIKERVRIRDFSDLELMEILADLGGDKGEVEASSISQRLFGNVVKDDAVRAYANQCVGARMGWMSRFGFVDKGEYPGTWRLSKPGNELRKGRLTPNFARNILDTNEASVMHLAQAVGDRVMTTGDIAFKAMERQIRYNVTRRKDR